MIRRATRALHSVCSWAGGIIPAGALLAVGLLLAYGILLTGDVGALARDYGHVFLDTIDAQTKALRDGAILYWDGVQYGGTASWGRPNTAPLYPPLMLSTLLLGPAVGLNVCLLLHVLFGALGAFVLVRAITQDAAAAVLGGVVFLFGWPMLLFTYVLPLEAIALSFAPWTMHLLLQGKLADLAWLRFGILAGCLQALGTWSGGYVARLPSLLVLCATAFAAGLRVPLARNLGGAVATLFVYGATYGLLSAARLFPTHAWIRVTNRAQGVAEALAMWGQLSLSEVWDWLLREGRVVTLLAVLALALALAALFRRRGGPLVAFAAGFTVIVLISEGTLHWLLYKYVPGFSLIREPQRAWLIMAVILPVLAGIATVRLAAAIGGGRRVRTAIGLGLAVLVAVEGRLWPAFERPEILSVSERVANNAVHLELAERAKSETRFRVHDYALTRPQLKQAADVIRSRLDLDSLEGILGNIWIPQYDDEYLALSRATRAKAWGLMNVRYVTSREAVDEPSLTFMHRFHRDIRPIAEGIDGPFLYRNELELPRAALVDHAILLVGAPRKFLEYWLVSGRFDPQKIAVAYADYDEATAFEPSLLQRFDMILMYDQGNRTEHKVYRLREAVKGSAVILLNMKQDLAAADMEILHRLERFPDSLQALPDPPRDWNRVTLKLPAGRRPAWLALAETCSLYPGWTATLGGERLQLIRGNGAATLIALPEQGETIVFDYLPPLLREGAIVNVAGLVLCAGLLAWAARRRARSRALSRP